jgi:hypothetical protein
VSDEQHPSDEKLPQAIEVTLTPEEMEMAYQVAVARLAKAEEARTTGRVILGRCWCTACGYPKAEDCRPEWQCCRNCTHPVYEATPVPTTEHQHFLTDTVACWCTACGYSIRSCGQKLNLTQGDLTQGELCCDVCDHPVWIATPMEEEE